MASPPDGAFSISTKQPLLSPDDNHKPIITCIFITTLIVAASVVFSFLYATRKPKQLDRYLAGSAQYYCHLTTYPDLCYDSMSAVINATVVRSNPTLIFSTSLEVAFDQVINTSARIEMAILLSTSNNSNNDNTLSRLSECRAWAAKSLSRLNDSMFLLQGELFNRIDLLTYQEMDDMEASVWAAANDAEKCLSGMEEVIRGVEEVKVGVERAMQCMVNCIRLLGMRDKILYEFHNPLAEYDGYYYYTYYEFDYTLMTCVYSVVYSLLAFLYLLFFRGH